VQYKILWHIDPLLGKGLETNKETTAVAKQQPRAPMDGLCRDNVGTPTVQAQLYKICWKHYVYAVRAKGL
jgi:hypothetical protein